MLLRLLAPAGRPKDADAEIGGQKLVNTEARG